MKMAESLKIGGKVWQWGKRTYIMGILNVTPDSFSDGGIFYDIKAALQHSAQMVSEGADIIDIGGESTRPGFTVLTAKEEIERVIPVVESLSKEADILISIDTYKAETADAAIKAGAHLINDIWGLKHDKEMAAVIAAAGVPVCIMHNRDNKDYNNLMEDVISDLAGSIEIAKKAGISDENIIIDPGIGFAKTYEQNLQVLRNMDMLKRLGYPVLLGVSRKSVIGLTLGLDVNNRLEGTLALTAYGIMKGADIVRVHDVLQNARTAAMTDAVARLL